MKLEVQTRRENGELRFFLTLKEALEDAKDEQVWKISFNLSTRERVRFCTQANG
jgi:hypothetical protein